MAPRTGSLPLENPYPNAIPPNIQITGDQSAVLPKEQNENGVSFEGGAMKVEQEDGSVVINFNPPQEVADDDDDFSANLARKLSENDLASLATDILDGIKRDEDSRKDWLETRARGITLLGLKIEQPRSGSATSAAPLEGMATVRHPILLENTIAFQATARAELLPASGPVKVRNDSAMPPKEQLMQTSALSSLADSLQQKDDLAEALEKDMNHYLTAVATEYVPDTDRMLFYVGFGGDGFKKVYNCPIRRRPVSESIDAEDLIISNAATDLNNCGRVTHKIRMRKATLKRMQILGVYLDVDLSPPPPPNPTPVDKKKDEIAGVRPIDQRPEDRDYEIYECYCELDLDEFAPKRFKGKGLPLPYRVTIEKESHKILDIRRNWREDDKEALAKRYFVQFPFVRGLGFYGLGFIHILGNTANALTAAWRLILDAGMFGNFPGFIYAKGLGRQYSNDFRIAPGTGQGLDIGAQQSIKDAVMPVPYKEAGPSFVNFITHVEEVGGRVAATGNAKVGEGKQDAPVGTTLALIEQATKVMDSAHKRLHAAQAEEFKLLKERFQEDPEAFWRHNRTPTVQWKKDQFLEALSKNDLVPVADPNNPTSLHRIAKAMTIKELQKASPALYDPVAVDMRVMRIVNIDPQGLFRAAPAPQPPDPRMVAIQEKAKAQQVQSQINLLQAQIKAATAKEQMMDKEKDRESREKVEAMKIELEKLKIQEEQIIHAHDEERNRAMMMHNMQMNEREKSQLLQHKHAEKQLDLAHGHMERQQQFQHDEMESVRNHRHEREKHEAEMERSRQKHELDMEHAKELHTHKVAAAKAMAKAKPKAAAKKKD